MSELQRLHDADLAACDRQPAPTRTDQAVTWVGWHIAELAAIGLPLLLAVTVSWWLAGLSVLAGAAWAVHEVTTRRRTRTTTGTEAGARPLQAVPTTDSTENGEGIA